ncbi:MAG TPA: hypothetical protein VGR00_14135 [Thermoanaerobaculia bacterium]|nr:hypothetical protein [Thermoanaerobaculia bacterium]
MRERRADVGEILSRSGVLTLDALRKASLWQRRNGGSIERALLETGSVTEDDLLKALTSATGFPPARRCDLIDAPAELVSLLPHDERERLRALPFRLDGGILHVAAADPASPILETGLIASTGREIALHVAAEPVLDDVLAAWYVLEGAPSAQAAPEQDVASLEEQSTGAMERLARALLADALHVGAHEVEIGFDRLGGFAKNHRENATVTTRRLSAGVMPGLLTWFVERTATRSLYVDWATLDDVPRRYHVERETGNAGTIRLVLVEIPLPPPAAVPECEHPDDPSLVFCPLCGAAL